MSRQFAEIEAGFGVATPGEDAVGVSAERDEVPRAGEVGGDGGGVGEGAGG